MAVKLLTYDVYRTGMTLFKELADQTYQSIETLPSYALRKLAPSEVPAGYSEAYRVIKTVQGHDTVAGDTLGFIGDTAAGIIFSYIVGTTPMASDWLAKAPHDEPMTPNPDMLYLICSDDPVYKNSIFSYNATTSHYEEVQSGLGGGATFAYVVGSTPFAADWLSMDEHGSPLTPIDTQLYLVISPGKYYNIFYRWDSTLNAYIKVSGSGGGAIFSYIVGSTAYASDWLSDSVGGDPLSPEEGSLYLVLTTGPYFSALYRYSETDHLYILVSNARVVDCTKAEYLALPTAKQNDGTIYFITDSASSAPNKDDYIPSRATVPESPASGLVILWKGSTGGDFDVSPAFYRYDGTHWVHDNLGIEGQTIQVDTMPTAQSTNLGQVLQFIGTTTALYQHGYFYECKNTSGSIYEWVNVPVQSGESWQYATLPVASVDQLGKIFQYTGADGAYFKHGYIYECVEDSAPGTYYWKNIKVQPGDQIQVTTMPTAASALNGVVVQFIGTTTSTYQHGYFYECYNDSGTYRWRNIKVQPGDEIQFSTMPTASVDYLCKVVQFTGTTTNDYTHGYFYECMDLGSGNYAWVSFPTEKPETRLISQSDFDNLSTAEKNNGQAYFIPDARLQRQFAIRTGFTPVGTIISVMGGDAPRQYLKCDGTVYSISDYPELAQFFEDQFGASNEFGGDGISTFAVPSITGHPFEAVFCIAVRNVYVDARLDYSLSEYVCGTWIDGKPLYQRVFMIDPEITLSGALTDVTAYLDATDIAHCVEGKAFGLDPETTSCLLNCERLANGHVVVYVAGDVTASWPCGAILLRYTRLADYPS